jgi:hypothetical protein
VVDRDPLCNLFLRADDGPSVPQVADAALAPVAFGLDQHQAAGGASVGRVYALDLQVDAFADGCEEGLDVR